VNIASIRQLADTYTTEQLQQAEAALLNEETVMIEVPGVDEGEQLTHLIAALWVRAHKQSHGVDTLTAVREYTKRVRESIS
jgi:aryl-alcohol dehydrogenase-like predicted oxidoreductase